MYVCMYLRMYVYMYVFMYVCMYVHDVTVHVCTKCAFSLPGVLSLSL